jgi:TRAP-type mannitol/chloroaromatic compound transport system permease large subunit
MEYLYVAGLALTATIMCAAPFVVWRIHVIRMRTFAEKKAKRLASETEEERQLREHLESQAATRREVVEQISMLPIALGILFVVGTILFAIGKTVITWAFGVTFPGSF